MDFGIDWQQVFTIIGVVSSVLGLIALVVGISRYFYRIESNRENLTSSVERIALEHKLELAEARTEQLLETIRMSGKAGRAGLEIKGELDSWLQRTMAAAGASGGSVYAPIEGGNGVAGLSFLTIEPFNRQNRLLKEKIIPMRSMAGRCFLSSETILHKNVGNATERFGGAAAISDYQPASSINIPLSHQGETIGVLQLLRRQGEVPFADEDLALVLPPADKIGELVSQLRQFPEIRGAMSVGEVAEGTDATILFFDISSSSLLFREFATSFALKLLNEFFEQTCEIGFDHGGALDNYMGDGALMRFNIPRAGDNHELQAAKAALSMLREFPTVRHYWAELNPQLAKVHFRAGLSAGSLLEGPVGHSLVRTLGVAGLPITVASALCNAAPRDRSVIYLDSVMAERLGGSAQFKSVEIDGNDKLAASTESVYELLSIVDEISP